MQKVKVEGQRPKVNSKWGFIRDIECVCGYIATFETWQFVCPDCGRKHYMFSNNITLPNTACTGRLDSSATQSSSTVEGIAPAKARGAKRRQ